MKLSVALVGMATAVVTGVAAAESDEPLWHVEGIMSDACQCIVFCPCEMNEKPTFGHCDDTATMHIERGHFGDISLDNSRVVAVFQSPEGERLFDTVGHLRFARIYVPDETTDEQAEALEEIVGRVMGAFVTGEHRLAEDQKVRKVPMKIEIEDYHHRVEIPGVLDLDLDAELGSDNETPIIIQNIGGEGFGEVVVARSKVYRYTDNGKNWDYAGRSASIRSFDLSGEE